MCSRFARTKVTRKPSTATSLRWIIRTVLRLCSRAHSRLPDLGQPFRTRPTVEVMLRNPTTLCWTAQPGDPARHIGRQPALKPDPLAGRRMREAEHCRVERQPRGAGYEGPGQLAAMLMIARDRMSEAGEVESDLVAAPGLEPRSHQGRAGERLKHAH